jgi:predicted deacylase
MKKDYNKIHIASLGNINLDLPVIQVGKGKPKVIIVNNVHGNEQSGFYVLEKFLKLLPGNIKGAITIVSSANPLGLINRSRLTSVDSVDLNRGYPAFYKERGVSSLIKDKLIEIGMAHDVIFDIHSFNNPCLSAGIIIEQKNLKNKKIMNKSLQVLNTDISISLAENSEEKRVASSYTAYLASQGKIAFGVEYPPASNIDNKQIEAYASGLINMCSEVGLCEPGEDSRGASLPVFQRQQVIYLSSGLFVPDKELGDKVKKNDVIGNMINIETLKKEQVMSGYSGVVIEIAEQKFCLPGEKIATVGKKYSK